MLTKLVGWMAQFTPLRAELQELEMRRMLARQYAKQFRGAQDVALVLDNLEANSNGAAEVAGHGTRSAHDRSVWSAQHLFTELQRRTEGRAAMRAQRHCRAESEAYTRGTRVGFAAGQNSLSPLVSARDECDVLDQQNAGLSNEVARLELALRDADKDSDTAAHDARRELDLERARLDFMASCEAAFVWPAGNDGECFMVDGDGTVLSGTSGAGGGPITYTDPRQAIDAAIVNRFRFLHYQERAAA